jgi:hypothetical protein
VEVCIRDSDVLYDRNVSALRLSRKWKNAIAGSYRYIESESDVPHASYS